jgi:DNA adenine methylase
MTFLRWAGSKRQLSETLANCWYAAQCAGGNGKYIEAFTGSASLFFRLKPDEAVLIDVNKPLIECYKVIKNRYRAVFRVLASYPHSEDFYYALRSENVDNLNKIERAARFIYLNRFCFNGLYRTNLQGKFNVPYGAGRNGELPTESILGDASKVLKNADLIAGDFGKINCIVKKGDFVYLDPPYAKRNHSLDLQYGPDVFGVNDLIRLYDLLKSIDRKGAFFVFSYIDCEEISDFVKEWGEFKVEVKRTIAADSSKRTKATEVLISNI